MLRDRVVLRDRSPAIIEIKVVCQCDLISQCDWCNLVLDIAEECHVTYRWLVDGRKRLGRVEDPFVTVFVTVVPKEKSSTLMGRRKDDHERAKHLLAPWSTDMGLKERPFAWAATWSQIGANEDQILTVDA